MSSVDGDDDDVEEDTAIYLRARYEGEDTSPTTTRELNGWYAYPIAAEVFAVVAVGNITHLSLPNTSIYLAASSNKNIGAFLPVVLEQLARENGVFFSDRSKPCVDVSAPSPGRVRMRDEIGSEKDSEQCMISSFADHGPYRKKMLLTFAYIGSIVSALFIFISPSVYYLAPILVIIGVTSLGCSFVLLNAFLPLLVANHPDDSHAKPLSSDSSSDVELESLIPQNGSSTAASRFDPNKLPRDLERSAQISSKGVGYGYISAVFVQILSILILYLFSKTDVQKKNPSLSIRVILFLVGIWWAVFTIPTLLWLRQRPGPPLPTQQHTTRFSTSKPSRFRTFLFYTSFSLRSFWRTLRKAIRLRQTLLFLVSWFLLSDAVATISGTAVLFARTELHMGTIAIALLSITSIGSGVIGAFAWPRVQRHFGLQPKTVLLCCVAGMELIPLYGLLGYIPLFKSLGFIGLQQAWEIYPIAVLHGIVMGGISSYARSVYAPLIPENSEAAFFALYAVTDKGSSAFGPALVGWIVDRAGTIRPAFIFLAVLVVLPAPLLWWLNVEKGREDARAMADRDGRGRGAYERVSEE
ncbi:Nn.00g000590.m01.CDS01 [Neocucurbitaria sp. VM-36]